MKLNFSKTPVILLALSVSSPAFANDKIEGTCLRSFVTGDSGMKAKDYMPLCKCAAAQLEVAGMSGAERRQLEQKFDSELISKIFDRKPGSTQRADACLSAQRGNYN